MGGRGLASGFGIRTGSRSSDSPRTSPPRPGERPSGSLKTPTAGRPGERRGTLPGPVRAGRRRAVEDAHPRTGVVEHDPPGRCSRGEHQQRDDPDRHRGGARHQRRHPDRRRSSAAAGAGCRVDVSHASNDYGPARTLSVGSGAGRRLTCQAALYIRNRQAPHVMLSYGVRRARRRHRWHLRRLRGLGDVYRTAPPDQ